MPIIQPFCHTRNIFPLCLGRRDAARESDGDDQQRAFHVLNSCMPPARPARTSQRQTWSQFIATVKPVYRYGERIQVSDADPKTLKFSIRPAEGMISLALVHWNLKKKKKESVVGMSGSGLSEGRNRYARSPHDTILSCM